MGQPDITPTGVTNIWHNFPIYEMLQACIFGQKSIIYLFLLYILKLARLML